MFIIEIEGPVRSEYVCAGDYTRFELTSSLSKAKQFSSMEEVREALQDPEFTKRNETSDGTSAPPHMIWCGLSICYVRPKASGYIRIKEVVVTTVESIFIEDGFQ